MGDKTNTCTAFVEQPRRNPRSKMKSGGTNSSFYIIYTLSYSPIDFLLQYHNQAHHEEEALMAFVCLKKYLYCVNNEPVNEPWTQLPFSAHS